MGAVPADRVQHRNGVAGHVGERVRLFRVGRSARVAVVEDRQAEACGTGRVQECPRPVHAMIADAGQQHQRLPAHGSEHFVSDLDVHATQCGTSAARAASPDTSEMFLEYSSGALPGPRPQGEAPAKLHTGEPVSGRRTNAAPGSRALSTGDYTTHRHASPISSLARIYDTMLRVCYRY